MKRLFNIPCDNFVVEIGEIKFEITGICDPDLDEVHNHCGKFITPEGLRVFQILCNGVVFEPYCIQTEDGVWDIWVTGYLLTDWIAGQSNTKSNIYIIS